MTVYKSKFKMKTIQYFVQFFVILYRFTSSIYQMVYVQLSK